MKYVGIYNRAKFEDLYILIGYNKILISRTRNPLQGYRPF